jgi:hypothetical protein
LVEPIKKPEAKADKNQDESRPDDPLECPVIQLRRWMFWHAFAWVNFGKVIGISVGRLSGFILHTY